MFQFKNLAIRYKLLLIVLAPLLLALFFIGSKLILLKESSDQMSKSRDLSILAMNANQLVHEIQKERGMTAIFLSSQGNRFADKIKEQRKNTDKLLNVYRKSYSELSYTLSSPEQKKLGQSINQQLSDLPDIRNKIDSFNIPLPEALAKFTEKNKNLLDLNTQLSLELNEPDLSRSATAYVYFLQAKERAGIERAVIASLLSSSGEQIELRKRATTLGIEQEKFMELFRNLASQALLRNSEKHRDAQLWQNIQNVRDSISEGRTDSLVEASDWFNMATQRINLLKKAELAIENDFQKMMSQKKNSSQSAFYTILIIAIVGIAIAVLLCSYTVKGITEQLKTISSAMHQLGEKSNLKAHAQSNSDDDLGQLADSFNAMVAQMRTLIHNTKEADSSLNKTVNTLENISEAVNEQVNSGLGQTQMAAVAMNQMGSTVQEVAQNCSQAASQSEEANNSAESGNQMLQTVLSEMKQLSNELSSTNQVIQSLAEDSSEIGSILDVIRGVAEQTNLLALNAAIEAARAGEQGRGFAVVADEVRSLASKTQESTGQIQDNIEKLQQGSSKAVSAISSSLELAENTANSLNNSSENIGIVIQQISNLNKMNIQIATATEEQSIAVEDINKNVQFIQEQYNKTSSSLTSLNAATDEVSDLSKNLSENVKQFQV
ncbi:nitrate- and nitrite sensing domain-containing protein [uncultured Pseudoteredinibacter sp.]|uniref:methyl-accepting chemotaxis protein n=1 Tax=uncultured Pseudoteredinibacter sp. TaxID=1641701 RepID=UPI00261557E6|nr:nitrate- and nitrite sensing domain-containing protein [uncultured Pseudoteredinibacter sp.]